MVIHLNNFKLAVHTNLITIFSPYYVELDNEHHALVQIGTFKVSGFCIEIVQCTLIWHGKVD